MKFILTKPNCFFVMRNYNNCFFVKQKQLKPHELWSIELGHLTPTMKVKRKVVKERYKELFDKIYS